MPLLKSLKKISGSSAGSASDGLRDSDESTFVLGAAPDSDGASVLKFKPTQTVLDVILKNKIPIATSCGGMGTCGTCRIEVLNSPDGLAPRNEVEEEFARDRGFNENERLACQVDTCMGLRFFVPPLDE